MSLVSKDKMLSNEEIKGNLLLFTVNNIDVRRANDIRTYLFDRLPTMAIDKVDIHLNQSTRVDEVLAANLGLIPIKSSYASDFLGKTECSDICSKCSVQYRIKANAPLKDIYTVTNEDIKIVPDESYSDSHKETVPVKFNSEDKELPIPIIKLYNGEGIDVFCWARKGCGEMHAKWSSVCRVTYDTNNDKDFNFIVETGDQYTLSELLIKIKSYLQK